jgi:hypothetical protein
MPCNKPRMYESEAEKQERLAANKARKQKGERRADVAREEKRAREELQAENRRVAMEFIGGVGREAYPPTPSPPPTRDDPRMKLAGSDGFDPNKSAGLSRSKFEMPFKPRGGSTLRWPV